MAASKSIIVATLGSQTIRLAEFFSTAEGGLALNGVASQDLSADVGSDSLRNTQIRLALEQLRNQLGIKKGAELASALSGQSVFARFVKLPSVAANQVEQMVGFEAQQNVPFPINEVVWDYQLLGKDVSEGVEVVLVAIKADALDATAKALTESGFRPNLIDVAPMALYNAFRYSYSEVPGCSLIIDIGARTTNLLFTETGRVFSRSIPIGGATITAAIAKEFNCSFAVAEERKRRDGFVSLGGAYAAPSDPDVALVSKVIRNTMTRLHAEVGRSISFYRSQQQGSAPAQIFLCGGACGMPYLKEFFAEKLSLPIDYFNPLRNVAVTQQVSIDAVAREAHVLGELVGLALRRVSGCPMELNLRPAGVIKSEREARQRPAFVLAAICLVMALVGWGFFFQKSATAKTAVLEQIQAENAKRQTFETQIKSLEKRSKQIEDQVAPLLTAVADRQAWAEIVHELNTKLPPEYIWITVMEPTNGGKVVPFGPPTTGSGTSAASSAPSGTTEIDGIRVRGLYLYNEPRQAAVIVDFVSNLAKSTVFDVDPTKEAEVIKKSSTANQEQWAFDYELQLKLRRPIALK